MPGMGLCATVVLDNAPDFRAQGSSLRLSQLKDQSTENDGQNNSRGWRLHGSAG